MRNKVIFSIIIILLSGMSIMISCNKEKEIDNCYDEQLYQANKDNICPQDCPGVIGCDGKTYCNECEALKQGIKIKK